MPLEAVLSVLNSNKKNFGVLVFRCLSISDLFFCRVFRISSWKPGLPYKFLVCFVINCKDWHLQI